MRRWLPVSFITGAWLFSISVYSRLPDRVAVHWNLSGEPNRYASRVEGAFLLPALMAALYLTRPVTRVASRYHNRRLRLWRRDVGAARQSAAARPIELHLRHPHAVDAVERTRVDARASCRRVRNGCGRAVHDGQPILRATRWRGRRARERDPRRRYSGGVLLPALVSPPTRAAGHTALNGRLTPNRKHGACNAEGSSA
jgi:hypothetical protein